MEFEREDTPTIMDGKVIRWTFDPGWVNKPEISASRNGVAISGAWPIIANLTDINDVADMLREAFEHYRLLKSKP